MASLIAMPTRCERAYVERAER
ncbi:unnamed protein product [Ectocarpus sp. CCAP 1310/34]|nr:unnamed protein product [Ectocarpus sp. CCAP 1310/34]